MSTTDLAELNKDPRNYTWGMLLKIHTIGEYSIVEYHPRVVEGCTVTQAINFSEKNFSCYINGKPCSMSCLSLDAALAHCIAEKHDGINTRADMYFLRMLGMK